MKAILISIKPQWVAKILNGEKTLEVRKSMPKCDLPIDVYIYCTKEDSLGRIKELPKDRYFVDCVETPQDFAKMDSGYDGKGKVVAKFTLNNVDEHHVLPTERILPFNWNVEKKLKDLCLTKEEVMAYGNGEDYQAFLWHIDNLVIFGRPKELSEFRSANKYEAFINTIKVYRVYKPLTKAPQSWCYVEI